MVELLDIRLSHLDDLADGRQFEWEAIGEGEPMLWIEGGPGFPAHLARPDAALLGARFRVHLVNAPGCGRSSGLDRPEDYDLAGHVSFFDAVRSALRIDRWALAGHSWGGLVAVAYAAMKPEVIRRLVVIDGYAGGGSVSDEDAAAERERSFARVRDQSWFPAAYAALEASNDLETPTEQQDVDAFAPAWPLYFADPELPANRAHVERLARELRSNVDVVIPWNQRYEAADRRDLARGVSCPTLIVAGEHDFICGPVWNRALADAIPGSTYVQIADAGHMPQYEQPDVLMGVVESWLEGSDAAQVNSKKDTPRIV